MSRKRDKQREIEKIRVDQIVVRLGRRIPSADKVEQFAQSMTDVGLRTPITIFPLEPLDGQDSYMLVAGAHRLEAAKLLGWEQIECFVTDEEALAVSSGAKMIKNHRFEIGQACRLCSRPPILPSCSGQSRPSPDGWPRAARPALTAPARERLRFSVVGTEDARGAGRTKDGASRRSTSSLALT